MNEPSPPIPAPPSRPFAVEPASPPGGCGKPLLIGCGVLAVLLGIGAILFVVKAKTLLAFALEKLESEVVANLPEDLGATDRQRLEAGFDATLARIRTGQIDPERLQTLQARLVAAAERSARKELTRDEVLALTVALEEFAGIEPPGAEESAPSPEAEPPAGDGGGTEPTPADSPVAA